ncbi:N-acyl homoserine lactonase family protein [Nocardia sp. NPDC058518]|uniref:N-acyl homoserine lactonase family protein n=1 Tax=Nocardia sp. NPDC058518 TaxID=3346534 RepID=UPI00365F268A
MALTVQALKVGTVHGFSQAALTFSRGQFEGIDFAIYMFLVRGGDKLLLVDTGPGTPAEVKERHGFDMTQLPDEEPRAALAKAGVKPEDIEVVVNTHLHWDHCSNNDLFTNAQILVQGSELHYAAHPLPTGRASYERKPGMSPAWAKAFGRTVGRDGDYELMPGVDVVTLPGHTPGSQGVLVQASKRYLIAGDCISCYANWEGDAGIAHIPSGSFTSLEDYFRTFDKIEGFGCAVIPSHDLTVADHPFFD